MKKYFLLILAALPLLFYGQGASLDCPVNRWKTSGEVLLWHASQTSSDWAFVVNADHTEFTSQDADFGWDAGCRVGLGYTFEYDQWDTKLSYTWFRQQLKDHVSVPSGSIIEPIFYTPATLAAVALPNGPGGIEVAIPLDSGSLNWSFLFNMFDWDLSRNFCVSPSFSFRPSIGVKGGWIHQDIRTEFHETTGGQNIIGEQKNDFWGVGPNLGAGGKWIFGHVGSHSFSVFGNGSGAFMWGHWDFQDSSHYSQTLVTYDTIYPSHNYGAWMTRYLMGFEWALSTRRVCYSMQLGYELQCWFDQLKLMGIIQGRMQEHLTLQGGVFNFCLDF